MSLTSFYQIICWSLLPLTIISVHQKTTSGLIVQWKEFMMDAGKLTFYYVLYNWLVNLINSAVVLIVVHA